MKEFVTQSRISEWLTLARNLFPQEVKQQAVDGNTPLPDQVIPAQTADYPITGSPSVNPDEA